MKVTKWIVKIGSGISKMWIILPPSDRSRDTAHAKWLLLITYMWYNWVIHNSVTDNRRIIKISMLVEHARHNVWNTVKPNGQRSQGHATWWHNRIYPIKVTPYWKVICLIGIRGRRRNGGVRFLIGSSWIAVSAYAKWKYAKTLLIVLSNRHNFNPFIGNRDRWTRWLCTAD